MDSYGSMVIAIPKTSLGFRDSKKFSFLNAAALKGLSCTQSPSVEKR